MTKAREIAELGQKLTVDGSGNLDIAGSGTFDGLTVDGATHIDGSFIADTGTGTQNFNITRSGQTDQSLTMWVDDANVHLLSSQDEADTSYGGYYFKSSNGNNTNQVLLYMNQQMTTFNEGGRDLDFRVESDNSTHALFVEGSTDRIGINNGDPNYDLEVGNQNVNVSRTISIAAAGDAEKRLVFRRSTSDDWVFKEDTAENFSIDGLSGKELVINQAGSDVDFRVESDANANMFRIDAADNSVHIGTTTKAGVLTATGGSSALPTAYLYGSSAASEGNFIMALRDSTAQTGTAGVAGLKFTSSPSTDWVIGKSWDTTYSRFFIGSQSGTREFSLRTDFFQFYSGGWINEGGNDHDFGVESLNNGYMFWVDGTNDTVVLNGSGTSTTGALYINSYTSGDEPMVKIDRGGGSHKGSGILISGANYTNGTDSNAAFLAMNGGNYSTSLTKMIHAYDNGGSYFIVQGDGRTSFGHGNTAGATIDVVADANAEAIDVRGRSSDNIGEINFRPNGGGTQYARVDGRPDGSRGLGLYTYGSRDIQIGVNGNSRHEIVGQKGASYSNHQRYGSFRNGAQTYGQWVDTRSSPTGGDINAQIFTDCYGEWIVVAKWASNTGLSTSVTSADQISTTTSQVSSNELSSAWGDSYPTEVRYISASQFEFWRDTRVIDFIHGVPSGRQWKHFWSSGNSSGYATGGNDWSNSTRAGWDCTYCYDGFGRWHNPNYSFHRNLDSTSHTGNVSSAFTTSGTAYVFGTADDSKFSCHKTAASSGQDAEYSQQWGEDDNNSVRYEDYPAVGNNGGSTNQSSYNLWVLIKIAPNGEV